MTSPTSGYGFTIGPQERAVGPSRALFPHRNGTSTIRADVDASVGSDEPPLHDPGRYRVSRFHVGKQTPDSGGSLPPESLFPTDEDSPEFGATVNPDHHPDSRNGRSFDIWKNGDVVQSVTIDSHNTAGRSAATEDAVRYGDSAAGDAAAPELTERRL